MTAYDEQICRETEMVGEVQLFMLINWFLSARYGLIQESAIPVMCRVNCRWERKMI